jgi:hypothetical protein
VTLTTNKLLLVVAGFLLIINYSVMSPGEAGRLLYLLCHALAWNTGAALVPVLIGALARIPATNKNRAHLVAIIVIQCLAIAGNLYNQTHGA